VDDLVPGLVAQLGHVHAERDQHVEGVAWRHAALGERAAEIDGFGLGVAAAEQFALEQVERSMTRLLAERVEAARV
jgi:hypothetical protein